MASISVSGIICAGRTGGWRGSTARAGAALLLAATLPGAAPAPGGQVEVSFTGLRSSEGLLRVCLTRDAAHFPECNLDPAAHKRSIPADPGAHVVFADVAPGRYAIVVLHDKNSNGKVDTLFRIPREGIGFSNNPVIRTGPPKFAATLFDVGAARVRETIALRYWL